MRKARLLLAALVTLALTPFCSAQSQLVGEWSGTLSTPGGLAHILWHVVKAPDGSVRCSFDNVDEGVLGIKVKTLTVKDSEVTVVIDDVIHPDGQDVPLAGTYVGKLSLDGNEVAGTWSQAQPNQEQPVELTFKRDKAAPAGAVSPQVAGDWHGALSAGGAELHLVFHFTAGSGGTLGGTLDSVDQGEQWNSNHVRDAEGLETQPHRGCGPRHLRRHTQSGCSCDQGHLVAGHATRVESRTGLPQGR